MKRNLSIRQWLKKAGQGQDNRQGPDKKYHKGAGTWREEAG